MIEALQLATPMGGEIFTVHLEGSHKERKVSFLNLGHVKKRPDMAVLSFTLKNKI